jgi:hypothetical protein
MLWRARRLLSECAPVPAGAGSVANNATVLRPAPWPLPVAALSAKNFSASDRLNVAESLRGFDPKVNLAAASMPPSSWYSPLFYRFAIPNSFPIFFYLFEIQMYFGRCQVPLGIFHAIGNGEHLSAYVAVCCAARPIDQTRRLCRDICRRWRARGGRP